MKKAVKDTEEATKLRSQHASAADRLLQLQQETAVLESRQSDRRSEIERAEREEQATIAERDSRVDDFDTKPDATNQRSIRGGCTPLLAPPRTLRCLREYGLVSKSSTGLSLSAMAACPSLYACSISA